MTTTRRSLVAAAGAMAALPAAPRRARAQEGPLRVGVLTDMSGPYRDATGPSSASATRMAAAEFSAARGLPVEVLAADHQNKPDVGASIARQWFDRDGVDMILDVPTSSVAFAVSGIAREKNKVFVGSGVASSELTGAQCSPNTVHWTYDTYMLSKSTASAVVRNGGDTWFFVTADYTFGHALEADATRFVQGAGGRVLGSRRYPFPATTDYSSLLVQAQASGAKVLGLANASQDTATCIKQAREFGLQNRMKFAALLMGLVDVAALGLESAQGLLLTESFYWDLNDRTRAFARRLAQAAPAATPGMVPAGCYAGTQHWLKAVADLGGAGARGNGLAIVERMKAMPTDDDCFGAGTIRADGRKTMPVHLFEVKAPSESRGRWDLYKVARTTPADEAFRPIADGACPYLRG